MEVENSDFEKLFELKSIEPVTCVDSPYGDGYLTCRFDASGMLGMLRTIAQANMGFPPDMEFDPDDVVINGTLKIVQMGDGRILAGFTEFQNRIGYRISQSIPDELFTASDMALDIIAIPRFYCNQEHDQINSYKNKEDRNLPG